MLINVYPHVHTLDELFRDTVAKHVHSHDMSVMENIVYNFTGKTPGYYVSMDEETVELVTEKSNDAIGLLFTALDHFMDNQDQMKYSKLGIDNPKLISLIEESYKIDSFLSNVHPKLENYCAGIYGNFDTTIDEAGKVWFYEYNGNTPVMTYESIVIQELALNKLGFDESMQFNMLYEQWVAYFAKMREDFGGPLRIAFAGFSELVCDLLTTDSMCSAATLAGHDAIIVDLRQDIDVDTATDLLYVKGDESPIDYLFTLYPWEEFDDDSLDLFMNNYRSLRENGKGTIIAEPAYKVVMSNKAFLAYVTEHFTEQALEVGIIPTFVNNTELKKSGEMYVGKPVYGRLSGNITVFSGGDTGAIVNKTEGEFSDNMKIFQPFVPLVKTAVGSLQFRSWVAPNAETYEFEACGFAVRKSNSEYSMATESEEFLPHVIIK